MATHPTRPSIPPLAWCAAGLWCGAAVAEELSWRVYASGARADWVWEAMTLLVVLAAGAASRRQFAVAVLVGLLLAGCAAGLGLGGMYWTRWRTDAATIAASRPAEWSGVVVEDPSTGLSGLRVTVRLDGPVGASASRETGTCGSGAIVSLRWPKGAREPALGMRVTFKARFAALDAAKPGARDGERAGESAGGSVWAVTGAEWPDGPAGVIARWRAATLARIVPIRGPGGDLLASTLLGDRRRISGTPAEDALRASGAAHLVAASGLHLGLACLVIAWMVRVAGGHRRAQTAGVVVAGCTFAMATGLRVAVVRALLLVVAALLASLLGRRR